MNNLIAALQAFNKAYEGDPEGLASDFTLITGHTIQELTDLLQDEADEMNSFED